MSALASEIPRCAGRTAIYTDGSRRLARDTRVLVVDDFPTMRTIVRNQLAQLGLENVAEADDGETALPMLRSGEFEFLITDWSMPGMCGIDLLRAVRADPALADLPVLMVTAECTRAQVVEAMQAGVDGYIAKPFNIATLREKVEAVFGVRAPA